MLVMTGAKLGLTIVSPNVLGPSLPVEFVAVIGKELTAAAFGVPDSKPLEEREAHPGNPDPALQVIGLVPVAVN